MKIKSAVLVILQFCFLTAFAQSHKGLSFQAVIKSPTGDLIEKSGLTLNAKVLSSNNCILREEEFNGVSINQGYLSLVVGQGSTTGSDPNLSLGMVMDNSAVVSGLVCLASDGSVNSGLTSYDPGVSSGIRKLRISFTVDGVPIEADFNMRAVAYAVNAETLDGKRSSDFVRISDPISETSIASFPFNKLTSVPSPLVEIGGLSCADGKLLKKVSGSWACADESGVGSESDPTVQTYAKAAPGSGLHVVTGQLQVKMADVQSAATGNWAINVTGNAATATSATSAATATTAGNFTGSLSGDVSGTQGATKVDKINGVNAATAVAGDDGKFMKFTNGTGWHPQVVKLSELKNASGLSSAFNVASCDSSQTLIWSSITDQFSCQNIILTKSRISDFPTLANVATSGSYNDLADKPAISNGTVTGVTATAGTPVVMGGTEAAPTVGMSVASTSSNGYLTSADWNTFNGKQASLGFTPQQQNTELTALAGISFTGIIKRTGANTYGGMSVSAPITDSGTALGLALSSTGGLYLNSGSLSIKLGAGLSVDGSNQLAVNYGTAAGTAAQGNDSRIVNAVQTSDARLPASTCASGSFNRWNGSAWVCETDQNTGGGGSQWTTTVNDISYTAGKVGVGTTTPKVAMDIAGEIRLNKNSSAPFACDATHDGAIALTNIYTTCVCKSASGWVLTSNGQSACGWATTSTTADIFGDNSALALYQFENNVNDTRGAFNGAGTSVSYTSGRFGMSAGFGDAKNMLITRMSTNSTAMAFSFWVNPQTAANAIVFMGFPFATFSGQRGFYFTYDFAAQAYADGLGTANNSFHVYNAGNTNSDIGANLASAAIAKNSWSHVVFSFNQPYMTIYVNGTLAGSVTNAAWTQLAAFSANTNWIFGDTLYTSNASDTYFDQVRVFNRALTASEISILYNEQ